MDDTVGPVCQESSEAAPTAGRSTSAPATVLQGLSATLRADPNREGASCTALRLAHELPMVLPVFREDPVCIQSGFCPVALFVHNLLFSSVKG